jgi:2-haloacid dehalogenase
MKHAHFDTLTFDCYGTLIDWERGLASALLPILALRGILADEGKLLSLYAKVEARIEAAEFRPYRDVLTGTLEAVAAHYDFVPTPAERAVFPELLALWPPFPDSVAALKKLGEKYTLVALTNCDDDLFAHSAIALGSPFDAVFTAQQVRSYKPRTGHFLKMMERFGRGNVLHVAQGLYHDIAPARALSLATCWVDRSCGTTPSLEATPDITVPDLAALVEVLGA